MKKIISILLFATLFSCIEELEPIQAIENKEYLATGDTTIYYSSVNYMMFINVYNSGDHVDSSLHVIDEKLDVIKIQGFKNNYISFDVKPDRVEFYQLKKCSYTVKFENSLLW